MPIAELLAPAGDLERLKTALRFGADAVYVGGPKLQLRAGSVGFALPQLAEGARLCHEKGKKLYVTVNAFPNDGEIDGLGDYARALSDAGADAVIAADLGAIDEIRRRAPELEVHVSTQANCMNHAAARVYWRMGVKRVVLAREMTLDQIRELRDRTPPELELEAFAHGAMCMAYSGRCMISAFLTGRSANRGACTQPCRWRYALTEEKRPGEFFPVEEDAGGMTLLSSCDLNTLGFVDRLMDAGVTSLKLEGRMKSPYYVATVTNAYRMRLDGLARGESSLAFLASLQRELDAVSHRPYASGFYFGEMKRAAGETGVYRQDCEFAGVVVERLPRGRVRVEQRNRVRAGDALEALSPGRLGAPFVAANLTDANGAPIDEAAVPMMRFDLDAPEGVGPGDLLRLRRPAERRA